MGKGVAWALAAIGSLGWFITSTALGDAVPDAITVLAGALAFVFLAIIYAGRPGVALRGAAPSAVVQAALGGALAGAVAPAVVLAHRYTDAPPGSEVIVFTSAAWALVAVLIAAVWERRAQAMPVAAALVGFLGAAAVAANWERPSSFSPFVRYPREESAFLIAGAIWVFGLLLVLRSARRFSRSGALVAAGGGAVAAALMWVAFTGALANLTRSAGQIPALASAGVAAAALLGGWLYAAEQRGVALASSALLTPVVGMTLVGVGEQVLAPQGPNPLIWRGILGGVVLIAVSVTLLASHRDQSGALLGVGGLAHATDTALPMIERWLVAASLVGGFAALTSPALVGHVRGHLENGQAYDVSWVLPGFETVAGWLPLAAALILAAGQIARAQNGVVALRRACAAAIAIIATAPLAAGVPLHTWNRWIPYDIQSAFGTEYTSLQFTTIVHPVFVLALVLVVLSVVTSVVRSSRPTQAFGSGVSSAPHTPPNPREER